MLPIAGQTAGPNGLNMDTLWTLMGSRGCLRLKISIKKFNLKNQKKFHGQHRALQLVMQ